MGMLERVNSVSSTYVAMIQHDIREVQNDLDRINNILSMVGENQDKVYLLKNSLRIRNDIETASIKPFREETTVSPDVLPRELIRIREIVDNYPALISLL
jgi:hypothetical protein|mmetsp:Transcript_30670/g.5532  ORF Transcript_30670/g.5532 Transcript_30670/m.5532 type:complete len:100 (+) Transcript_30670:516-815(+)